MQRAIKRNSGLYAYLLSTKVLENGTEQDIAKAREQYWRDYKANWRRNKRKTEKSFTISFTGNELSVLSTTAKKHKKSVSALIKASCLAYIQKQYVVPDVYAVNSVRELLTMNYMSLKSAFDNLNVPYQVGIELLNRMSELEANVTTQLYNPKSLDDLVIEAINKEPEYKERLLQLLQNL